MRWGLGFDFKIHWKQLAPSLPSPFLFRSSPAYTPNAARACSLVWPRGPSGLRALSPLQRCGRQPLTPLRSAQDIKPFLITAGEGRDLRRVKRNQMSLMIGLETGGFVVIVAKHRLQPERLQLQICRARKPQCTRVLAGRLTRTSASPKETSLCWSELDPCWHPTHQMHVCATFADKQALKFQT